MSRVTVGGFLLAVASGASAGPAQDAGVIAAVGMWDLHPTIYAILALMVNMAAAVWGTVKVLKLLRG